MKRAISGITLVLLATAGAFAQTDAAAPAFEVASVKVAAPMPAGMMFISIGGGPVSTDPGRITYSGVTLKILIARAYNVKEYQVEGPQWLDGERYDVIATIPKGADKQQVALMTQRLLAERFKLTLHHDSKQLAVYTLSVGKGGPKLKEVDPAKLPAPPAMPPGAVPLPPPPPPPPGSGRGPMPGVAMPAGAMRMMMGPNNRRISGNLSLARLCDMLSNVTDRPVIDLTELKGIYEIDLSWTPDDNERLGGRLPMGMAPPPGGPPPSAGPPPAGGPPEGASDPGLTLAQALETNYGLKLEAKRNPADILVVDRAEKVPTEN
jgi:uncharacterized protein (TIGR03435 family)